MLEEKGISEELLKLGYETKVLPKGIEVELPLYLFSSIKIMDADHTFEIVPIFGNVKRNIGIYIDIFVAIVAGIAIVTTVEVGIGFKSIIIGMLFLACIWDAYRYRKTEQVSNLIENIISSQRYC